MPELWPAACIADEDDIEGLCVEFGSFTNSNSATAASSAAANKRLYEWRCSKVGNAEFYKLKWLSRQGSLRALEYIQSLAEFKYRKQLEEDVRILEQQVSLSTGEGTEAAAGAEASPVPTGAADPQITMKTAEEESKAGADAVTTAAMWKKKLLISKTRTLPEIESDCRSAAESLNNVVRCVNSFKVYKSCNSAEYKYVKSILEQPWALIDVSEILCRNTTNSQQGEGREK